MRLSIFLSIAILAVSGRIAAQTQVQPPVRPYSVVSYNLLLDWRNVFTKKSQIFSGRNEIQAVLNEKTAYIALDGQEMTIDSINIDGQRVTTPGVFGDTISIPLDPSYQAIGTKLNLTIWYTHTTAANDPDAGMYFYPKGTKSYYSGTIPEDLAYTMSEPLGARRWMPCNDQPYSKSASSISIIVPSGFSAQSNGTLQSVDTNLLDGSHTYNWQSDRPIATYLMCAYASKWVTWRDYYHRFSNPNDSVPVIYYAWQQDYDAPDTTVGRLSARFAFRNTPQLIENDSKLFGEYPFAQYSQVPLEPFGFGGMEHQTITALDRGILNGKDESTIAHELFHHWFGDKTTCETWADIWLNEGFATFGEMLWSQSTGGTSGYNDRVNSFANGYFSSNLLAPTYNPPVDQMFNWPYVAVVYYKPGCVLHMLRRVLDNDTLFFNTLRDYSNAYAYTTANTFQFRDFIAQRDNAVAPMDLTDFVNEWIFQADFPVYNIRWATFGNELTVQVDQTQDSTDHYTMPLRFKAVGQSDTLNLVFLNNARSQRFTTQLPHSINTLIFDTNAVIISNLSMRQDESLAINSVVTANRPLQIFITRNSVKLTYTPIVTGSADVEILDVLGRSVIEQPLGIGSALMVLSTSSLASGNYFARIHDGSRTETVKFNLEK